MKIEGYDIREDRYYYFGDNIHIWVKADGDTAKMGIDDFTQKLSKGISFVYFQKDEGGEVSKGELIATLETAKMVLPINSPISGKIVSLNKSLEDNPTSVNKSPYGEGWLAELEVGKLSEVKELIKGDDKDFKKMFKKEIEKYEG